MKNKILRNILSATSLLALMVMATSTLFAAPVKFTQVVQVVNAKPGKANTGGFTQLRLADDNVAVNSTEDDTNAPQQDRVITETKTEIVEDEACDCIPIPAGDGFPRWPLFGLSAIPLAIVLLNNNDSTPTPTPTPTGTPSTPTPTPTTTPTPTPTATPTPTPTLTPTPEPVPEPMTILLFGTGLAGIGVAARKRLRRKSENADDSDGEA